MSSRVARTFWHRWMSITVAGGLASIFAAPAFSQEPPESAPPPTLEAPPASPKSDGPPADAAASSPEKMAKPKTSRARKPKPNKSEAADRKKAEAKKFEVKKPEDKKADGKKDALPPTTLAGAAAAGAGAANLNIAAQLAQSGAATCSSTIDAEAVPSMIGVTQSNTVTTWSNVEPRDKHNVSVFVGQRYGASQAVPYGVTGLIASPNPSGSCDSTVIQVVSSPLPCTNVRDTLLRQGKPGGDLAGVLLVQSAEGQTLLMPTATNTCVLVGFHSTYRK